MKQPDWRFVGLMLLVVALASAAPNAFPIAQLGYASLRDLGLFLILPSAVLLFALGGFGMSRSNDRIAGVIFGGALAGAIATVALEAVRYPGFRLGFMPGNLPELMGVLLLDRFAQGPSMTSSLAGFVYHFWNGACFGIIYSACGLARRSPLWAAVYGVVIGIGFLASPVVQSLGGGFLGRDFGWHFAATVLSAHAAFGIVLGLILSSRDKLRLLKQIPFYRTDGASTPSRRRAPRKTGGLEAPQGKKENPAGSRWSWPCRLPWRPHC